jgi:hypothetical protein
VRAVTARSASLCSLPAPTTRAAKPKPASGRFTKPPPQEPALPSQPWTQSWKPLFTPPTRPQPRPNTKNHNNPGTAYLIQIQQYTINLPAVSLRRRRRPPGRPGHQRHHHHPPGSSPSHTTGRQEAVTAGMIRDRQSAGSRLLQDRAADRHHGCGLLARRGDAPRRKTLAKLSRRVCHCC